jgi:hypothetical protein
MLDQSLLTPCNDFFDNEGHFDRLGASPRAGSQGQSASGYSDAILGYVTGSRTFAMCGFVLSTPSGSSAAESFLCLRSHRSLLE